MTSYSQLRDSQKARILDFLIKERPSANPNRPPHIGITSNRNHLISLWDFAVWGTADEFVQSREIQQVLNGN